MSKENELRIEIEKTQAKYHEDSPTAPQAALHELADKLKLLRKALNDLLSEGAKACPRCGRAALCMLKSKNGDTEIYEAGCLDCLNYRARGGSAAVAVERWNAGEMTNEERPPIT